MRLDNYTVGTYTPGASIVRQLLWYFIGAPLFSSYWLPITDFKVWLLRRFGAKIGQQVTIKPGVKVKFPWRLTVGDYVWIGENAWLDNIAPITIDSHVCLSQDVYLCTGNHDYSDRNFKLIAAPIHIHQGSWIAARAIVGPGVTVGEGAVLSLASVTGRSLQPMIIYAGNPAQPLKKRII
jgi:putative colanic acid biosynthesis acetyltransferase WcaF